MCLHLLHAGAPMLQKSDVPKTVSRQNHSAGSASISIRQEAQAELLYLLRAWALLFLLIADQLMGSGSDPNIGAAGRAAGLFAGYVDEDYFTERQIADVYLRL